MRKFFLIIFFSLNLFALNFPNLSGVIVDEANLLDKNVTSFLAKALLANEANTTNQFVIATIKSLDNLTIEEYSLKLARHWQIGQKDKDNGILLVVAPNERKVRVEVGYGLEGILTDALASYVINEFILEKFKKNDYQGGIKDGAVEILKILQGKNLEYEEENKRYKALGIFLMIAFGSFFLLITAELFVFDTIRFFGAVGLCLSILMMPIAYYAYLLLGDFTLLVMLIVFGALFVGVVMWLDGAMGGSYSSYSSSSYSGGSSSSSSGSSYSGGGGSFGGGGASGGW